MDTTKNMSKLRSMRDHECFPDSLVLPASPSLYSADLGAPYTLSAHSCKSSECRLYSHQMLK